MYTITLISMMTCPTLGMERTRAVTMSRRSLLIDTIRSTRSSRARRAIMANCPVAGTSANTITRKSNTFQPSRKYPVTRGDDAVILRSASTTNTASAHPIPDGHQLPELTIQRRRGPNPEQHGVDDDDRDYGGLEGRRLGHPTGYVRHPVKDFNEMPCW